MEQSDGPKRPKLVDAADGDEDRLSVLPDDILIDILAKLHRTTMDARTSVLSRRWRGLWKLLPVLNFPLGTEPPLGIEPKHIVSALTSHEAPVIRHLIVSLREAAAESVAMWLPIIAPRLFGELSIFNLRWDRDREIGTVELPCFQSADRICLNLDDHGLALPPSGVFARLTYLRMISIRMRGPCRLGDIVSSPRCPLLQKLFLRDSYVQDDVVVIHSESLLEIGIDNVLLHHDALGLRILAICSESVLQIDLKNLALRQLLVVAPALISLKEKGTHYIADAVDLSQPVVNISAPQLMLLEWNDSYDRSSVQFGKMAHLQWLHAGQFLVYGSDEDFAHNRIRLL
ncbi:putative F-box/FBD/LRR-repeat protein At3g49030 [Triticum urartu]|uniref:F-box domain-containing protein n=1 Tax=Triticum urartu TaxID=4572 RepID=A0A8R7PNU6_TRIUA|nr:putative F-box/FBD/LRR-repeat protein At3g49030 [Triticum urartu]